VIILHCKLGHFSLYCRIKDFCSFLIFKGFSRFQNCVLCLFFLGILIFWRYIPHIIFYKKECRHFKLTFWPEINFLRLCWLYRHRTCTTVRSSYFLWNRNNDLAGWNTLHALLLIAECICDFIREFSLFQISLVIHCYRFIRLL